VNHSNVKLPAEQRQILDMLGPEPLSVDAMMAATNYNAPQVVGVLTLLEMRGLCKRVPGNNFIVTQGDQDAELPANGEQLQLGGF